MRGIRCSKATRAFITFIAFGLTACCPHVSMVDLPRLIAQRPLASLVAAHRGPPLRGMAPDNSIAAITQSVANDIPYIEIDVRLSKDGTLFLFHDGSISSSNSSAPAIFRGRPIQGLSDQERSQVSLDHNQQVSIPTFAQALAAISGSKSALQVDLKGESEDLANAVVQEAERYRMLPQVLLQLRNPDRIATMRKRFPSLRILARCRSQAELENAIAQGVEFVELERWISSDAIAKAHQADIKVLINLAGSRLDEPATWSYFRSRGVDSVTSDQAIKHISGRSPRD